MSGPSDRHFDLNFGEEAAMPSQDNIWRPSFLSHTGPLTVGDSVMKNDMTAAVVARNLLTPKDNILLSKQSDELAVKDSLALSVQCAGNVGVGAKEVKEGVNVEGALVNYNISKFEIYQSSTTPDIQWILKTECSLLKRDSGIALLHHLQMLESGSLSDEGSPSSSSRFKPAMSGSSWLLLESCTKETLDDPHNCQTLANIGSSSMLVGEPSFHQWRYYYKMRLVKACTGYAECACRSEKERVVFDKRKAYCTWKKRWCFLYNDWEHAKGVTPERLTQGTIKLSGQELADVEKVLRVPKEDRHLVEKVGKKVETSTKKRRVPMLVPSEDILFHKEAHKHRGRPIIKTKSQEEVLKVAASKKAEAEAIGCAAAIVAEEDRRLLPPIPTINPIFPPVREHIGQKGDLSSSSEGKDKKKVGSIPWKDLKVAMRPKDFGYINNCLAGRRFTFDELEEPLAKDESDCDRILKLSSYHYFGSDDRLVMQVMAKYHDRLREVERCKWMAILNRYDDGSVLRKYCEEIDEHHRKGETFDLAVYSSSADESGDEASADEQSHQGDDEFGDAENGGRTQSDMIRGSTSDEDD
ncbi:unnamed protein product [Malus baccata var. baccata]